MPEIGQTISHYRILEKIGEGGMGQVYLAGIAAKLIIWVIIADWFRYKAVLQ